MPVAPGGGAAASRGRARGAGDRLQDAAKKATASQLRLASLGLVPRPIALASDDRFFAYSGATIG
jgi:hypothetical protein